MGGMSQSVSVRCPACGRAHLFAVPSYPCPCGTPVAPPLDPRAEPAAVTHRSWEEEWVTVHCAACDRPSAWPRPELGCSCGTVLRFPVTDVRGAVPGIPPRPVRPAFRPVAIRTARDAVITVALYLRWLGHRGVRRADRRPPSGAGLAAPGVLAWVDPTVRPADARNVECLWLTAMTESATACVYFSLAGYDDEARARADVLGVSLFVLDLAGAPQPVNGPAEAFAA
ncbi:hypothetical protein ACH4C6_18170 [Streptomyces sp. NPDC017943]|uniref:hypothetical protein n=1 Tax=Streptomyces sp. NPDC017943 TaxID=3365019 RepID=UPI0037A02E47